MPFDHQQAITISPDLPKELKCSMFVKLINWSENSNPKQDILFECLSLDNIMFLMYF